MKDSSDRILTTHAGSLARPPELREMLAAATSTAHTMPPPSPRACAAQSPESCASRWRSASTW